VPLDSAIEKFGRFVTDAAARASTFWERVADGMAIQQLWGEFKAETRASYDFYSKDVDWDAVKEQRGGRRKLYAARALAWAMLRKLSPSRRVFLLLTLAFAVIEFVNLHFEFGVLLVVAALLLSLALELADRVTMKRDLEIAR
jgi:sigma-B regulation protein RsbU (phosphoserine phosphatase)